MFNEDNTTEQMIISTLKKNGWEYISADDLDREESDVMVESMVREALIRLNPEIAEDESRADEIIYKLRTLFLSTNPQNLVTQNEAFKQMVFERTLIRLAKMVSRCPLTSSVPKSMANWIRTGMLLRTSGYIRRRKAANVWILCSL